MTTSTSYHREFRHPISNHDEPEHHYPSWSTRNRRGYGYYWWNVGAPVGQDTRFDAFYANGDGGQKIVIFPKLDIVVVITGSHYGKPIGAKQPWQLMHGYILPAVRD